MDVVILDLLNLLMKYLDRYCGAGFGISSAQTTVYTRNYPFHVSRIMFTKTYGVPQPNLTSKRRDSTSIFK